ncbi:MAG: DUF2892 domain-containing protein [Desulfovibrio sp.]
MTVENIIRATAGSFIIISTLLAITISLKWLWFTGFIGLNLFQSAFTGWCPLELLLNKFKS